MDRTKKLMAGIAAVAVALAVGAAKLVSRGGDDAVRGSDELSRILDDATRVPDQPGAAAGAAAADVSASSPVLRELQTRHAVHDILCEEFAALADPESPGVITREELLGSVASIAGERLVGVNPLYVQSVADDLLVANGLGQNFGGGAAQTYLRACPPLP